jgi:hypothetical protein
MLQDKKKKQTDIRNIVRNCWIYNIKKEINSSYIFHSFLNNSRMEATAFVFMQNTTVPTANNMDKNPIFAANDLLSSTMTLRANAD